MAATDGCGGGKACRYQFGASYGLSKQSAGRKSSDGRENPVASTTMSAWTVSVPSCWRLFSPWSLHSASSLSRRAPPSFRRTTTPRSSMPATSHLTHSARPVRMHSSTSELTMGVSVNSPGPPGGGATPCARSR
jgi:hypothetical protein